MLLTQERTSNPSLPGCARYPFAPILIRSQIGLQKNISSVNWLQCLLDAMKIIYDVLTGERLRSADKRLRKQYRLE